MTREKSRTVLAIEADTIKLAEIEAILVSQSIVSLDITAPAAGGTVGMTSAQIVEANGQRLVRITNLETAQLIFLNRDADAEMDKGDAVTPLTSIVIPLGDGQSLNAIGSSANVRFALQQYG